MAYYTAVAGLLPVLVLAWIVDFNLRARRISVQPTWIIWAALASYLIFFSAAVAGEIVALHVLRAGSATDLEDDLIELALIWVTAILVLDGLASVTTALENRTRVPLFLIVCVATVAVPMAGSIIAAAD